MIAYYYKRKALYMEISLERGDLRMASYMIWLIFCGVRSSVTARSRCLPDFCRWYWHRPSQAQIRCPQQQCHKHTAMAVAVKKARC